MKKGLVFLLIILLGVFALKEIASRVINYQLKSKLATLDSVDVNYEKASFSLSNHIEILALRISNKNFELYIPKLSLNNPSWLALAYGNIQLDKLVLNNPSFTKCTSSSITNKNEIAATTPTLPQINVDTVEIISGTVNTDDDKFSTEIAGLFMHLMVDAKHHIYDVYIHHSKCQNTFVQLGEFERLFVKHLYVEMNTLQINEAKIYTAFPKNEVVQNFTEEKSHMYIEFPKLIALGFRPQFNADFDLSLYAERLLLDHPLLEFFKDKRLKPYSKFKPLYNEVLTDLPIALDFPEIMVEKGKVVYSFKKDAKSTESYLNFENINASLYVCNKTDGQLGLMGESNFMNDGLLTLNLKFPKISSAYFEASGTLKNFDVAALNSFSNTAFSTKIEGKVNEVVYNLYGNNDYAKGNLSMDYENINISIFNETKSKLKKVVTGLVNLFVKEDSENKGELKATANFEVTRNQQKSLFNLLWVSLREGIIKAVI